MLERLLVWISLARKPDKWASLYPPAFKLPQLLLSWGRDLLSYQALAQLQTSEQHWCLRSDNLSFLPYPVTLDHCYNLILEVIFHFFFHILDFRPLQFCRTTQLVTQNQLCGRVLHEGLNARRRHSLGATLEAAYHTTKNSIASPKCKSCVRI